MRDEMSFKIQKLESHIADLKNHINCLEVECNELKKENVIHNEEKNENDKPGLSTIYADFGNTNKEKIDKPQKSKLNDDIENFKPFNILEPNKNTGSDIKLDKGIRDVIIDKRKPITDNDTKIPTNEENEIYDTSSAFNNVSSHQICTSMSIYIICIKLREKNTDNYIVNLNIAKDTVKKHIHQTKRFPVFVKKDTREELIISIYKQGIIKRTLVKEFGLLDFVGTFIFDGIKIKITKDENVFFPEYFRSKIVSRKNYLNALLSVELKNQSFLQKTLQYFNFMNTKWLLPDAKVYVKDLKTGEILEEKMYRMVKYYLTFFYTKRLSESRLYKNIMKNMTIKIGLKMNSPKSKSLIKPFIDYFEINMCEVKRPENGFRNFNDFFARELLPGSRKIDSIDSIASPADCRITAYKTIEEAKSIWIKGDKFTVESLVERQVKCKSLFVCRLAPQDYHRFHSPVSGYVESMREINGDYLTVHPVSVGKTNVLTQNKRIVVEIKSNFGQCFVVAIGAALVGSITMTVKVKQKINVMDELGYFEYGGSTVVVLFGKQININPKISQNSLTGIETLVQVGNSLSS